LQVYAIIKPKEDLKMLPKELIDFMRSVGVFPIVLATTDKNGELHTTFITWVYPVDDKTLRLALSPNAKSAKNMQETGKVAIMVFSANTALALYGNAKRDCSKNTNPLTQKGFSSKI
jgi:flavin reductase (DIM6/NTAB) family NADH-FMN oxidoreductase RutF